MKAVTEEIRLRIDEELDYELEAQNQRSLARIFRGHPFIVVPDVVTRMSRERVIVSEFVEGTGFEELKRCPDAERDRLGEIIFRFFMGCLYRHHQFSGDPHPGNFLLQADGRVAFLDFGLFKRMEAVRTSRTSSPVSASSPRATRRACTRCWRGSASCRSRRRSPRSR